jgi:hypothetical protein
MQKFTSEDWRAGRIREWLLLLLRFAITCDPNDKAAALALADEVDGLGQQWHQSAPRFFRRTTEEVCNAIIAPHNSRRTSVLKRHIARIDDPRLRRAFHAAVDIEQRLPLASAEAKRQNLWRGLPSVCAGSAARNQPLRRNRQ